MNEIFRFTEDEDKLWIFALWSLSISVCISILPMVSLCGYTTFFFCGLSVTLLKLSDLFSKYEHLSKLTFFEKKTITGTHMGLKEKFPSFIFMARRCYVILFVSHFSKQLFFHTIIKSFAQNLLRILKQLFELFNFFFEVFFHVYRLTMSLNVLDLK